MFKALFSMVGNIFLGLGMVVLAIFGLMAVAILVVLLFADQILKLIF
jgi:hypothetical protein